MYPEIVQVEYSESEAEFSIVSYKAAASVKNTQAEAAFTESLAVFLVLNAPKGGLKK